MVKQAIDGAVYNRQQKGHSVMWHIFFGWTSAYMYALYITFSPNHFWHA